MKHLNRWIFAPLRGWSFTPLRGLVLAGALLAALVSLALQPARAEDTGTVVA
jgi:hypothetical protein